MTMTYDVGNPNPDWGQAHICGVVKLVNGYQPTFFFIGSTRAIQI
jgi:hypothetical protein